MSNNFYDYMPRKVFIFCSPYLDSLNVLKAGRSGTALPGSSILLKLALDFRNRNSFRVYETIHTHLVGVYVDGSEDDILCALIGQLLLNF
uniref:Uncharacterized protein n=1 Tax=Onchocerca volvulus TaxID=6282 RepID=A0A8R1XU74_ONCVO